MCCELSIIIPAYQAESHLERCVNSILSGLHCSYEVIIVDDASSDGTLKLAQLLAEKHPQAIRVVGQARNSGVSASRNAGLDMAQGTFCMFVDADDQIEAEGCERLLMKQGESKADLACGNLLKVFPDGRSEKYFKRRKGVTQIQVARNLSRMRPFFPLLDSSCGKLFKTRLIKQHKLRFNTSLKFAEDTLFAHSYALLAESVLFDCDNIVYRYLQNDSSCMYKKNLKSRLEQLDTFLCELEKTSRFQGQKDLLLLRKACEVIWSIRKFSRSIEERKACLAALWQSKACKTGCYNCISLRGKMKHRLLWKLMTKSKNRLDWLWLSFW